MEPILFFVYNAESGLFNKLTDFAHKVVKPETYACSLCALTYGQLTMKQEWADYLKCLPLQVKFVYKNEWKFADVKNGYPFVALQTGKHAIKILLDATELNQIGSISQLKTRLDEALQNVR